jgi:hypothetical protein
LSDVTKTKWYQVNGNLGGSKSGLCGAEGTATVGVTRRCVGAVRVTRRCGGAVRVTRCCVGAVRVTRLCVGAVRVTRCTVRAAFKKADQWALKGPLN